MFSGTYTALATPFDRDGAVDYERLRALVRMQADAGVEGVVPVGTTGESPTVDVDEHRQIIDAVVESAADGLAVIAGTGANCTREATELTRHAIAAGADASLQVTPYYNKPNQEGLYRHFSAVADLGLPVVLYNVPGRSAQAIDVDTVARLAEHPQIVAIKEAGGSVDRVTQIRGRCDLAVLSGDDPLTLPMLSVGAVGVISVASNVIPRPVGDMVRAALAGDWKTAADLHHRYCPLFAGLFVDTNPIPVKAALAMMGLIEEVYRLPLCPLSADLRAGLEAQLRELDLIDAAAAASGG